MYACLSDNFTMMVILLLRKHREGHTNDNTDVVVVGLTNAQGIYIISLVV
jgi:hypothetical protein